MLNVAENLSGRKRVLDSVPPCAVPDGFPGGHTASMAAAAAVAEREGSPAFLRSHKQLTCGINRRCAVDVAAHKVLRDIVATFCSVLSQMVIRRVCTATLEQINAMLGMFHRDVTAAQPPPQVLANEAGGRFGGAVGSAIHEGLTSEGDQEYLQGMNEGSVAVLNACRDALESILHNLAAMVRLPPLGRLACVSGAKN